MNSSDAERFLAARFRRTKAPTEYGAGFETEHGRQIMLSRNRSTGVYVWVEVSPPFVAGTKMEHYPRSRGRASSLKANAPRLWLNNEAWKVVLQDGDQLAELVRWYSAILPS